MVQLVLQKESTQTHIPVHALAQEEYMLTNSPAISVNFTVSLSRCMTLMMTCDREEPHLDDFWDFWFGIQCWLWGFQVTSVHAICFSQQMLLHLSKPTKWRPSFSQQMIPISAVVWLTMPGKQPAQTSMNSSTFSFWCLLLVVVHAVVWLKLV